MSTGIRLCFAICLILAGCGKSASPPLTAAPPIPPVTFEDATERAGIDFVHVNGATGRKYLPETMGSGCAFLDYDNDGWQDILLVNGSAWNPALSTGSALRLYRNNHTGGFEDVTERAGLSVRMYGMGVAIGDYDGDGFDDIFLTGVGGCKLLHNETSPGGRRFRDVTDRAGVRSPGWATSATWLDYNRDGRLDLFVCHYVQWSPAGNRFYSVDGVHQSYSTPEQYAGESCRLYRNDGDGKFTDVSAQAGIVSRKSKALGVVAVDFDDDGWPDLFVTNDTQPNFLFHNQGDGTFKEVALETGIAVTEEGRAKAGMGVDAADDTNTGHESIAITNFAGEQLTLYRPDQSGHFLDEAARSGIGNASQFYLGFGVLFLDYDADGWQDIFIANGHIQADVELRQTGVLYREPPLLLRNTGGGAYTDVGAAVGPALRTPRIGRGAAWGDYDNDGYPDVLLATNRGDPAAPPAPQDGRPLLLHNRNLTGNHWLRLRLEGVQSNRNAFGARVQVRAGALTITRLLKASSSYLSQSDQRLLFGLGAARRADSIQVQWPAGQVQTLPPTDADRSLLIREGSAPAADTRGH